MNEISFEDFSVQTILHKGVFSRIYLASKKNGNDKGTLYAIKSQQKAKVLSSPIQSEAVLNEQLVLAKISGENFLTKLLYSFQSTSYFFLVTKYASKGSLYSVLQHHQINSDVALLIAAEIALGLETLRKLKIVHRDIKLENILFDCDGHVVISDFSLSKHLIDTDWTSGFAGTFYSMSPEIIKNMNSVEFYTYNGDYWSYGVVVYALLTHRIPFFDFDPEKLIRSILDQIPNVAEITNQTMQTFIMQLLEKNFEKRLGFESFSDIKQHQVFQEIDWTQIVNKNVEVLSNLPHKDFQSPVVNEHDYFIPDYFFVSPTLSIQKNDEKTQMELKANELLKKYGYSVKAEITCIDKVHRVSCPIDYCKAQGIKGIRVMKQKDMTGVILSNYERHIKKMHVK